jgi:hypothetical protein
MLMPLLLPCKLNFCKTCDSEENLLKVLLTQPPNLILFLETASADETWSDAHTFFMQSAIEWVQQQFFQDQLLFEFAQRLTTVIRKHPTLAQNYLPPNIILKLTDRDLPINTLMYGSSSQYLKDLIRLECRDRKADTIYLKNIAYTVLEPIHEYIMNGYSESLYLKDKVVGEQVLDLAQLWDLRDFKIECQQALKKWIHKGNVIETLLKSHKRNWMSLRSESFDYINQLDLDARLTESSSDRLIFEFLRFSENSFSLFQQLRMNITHIIFSRTTAEEPEFYQTLNACPHLVGLDLSHTQHFSQFHYIPDKVTELKLVACPWLNPESISTLFTICPQLEKLNLSANTELNYLVWVLLQKLKKLQDLSLARCAQITDQDIKLILESCDFVTSLNLEECRDITDRGFSEIPHLNAKLIYLNLSRTHISDLPLIEIVTHNPDLLHLNLTHCERITDKGIFEIIRGAKKMNELIIMNTNITDDAVRTAKTLRPFLKIITT